MTSARVAYAAMFSSLAGIVRVCIACGASAPFAGFEQAHGAGWTWCLRAGRIVWRCTECGPEVAT